MTMEWEKRARRDANLKNIRDTAIAISLAIPFVILLMAVWSGGWFQ